MSHADTLLASLSAEIDALAAFIDLLEQEAKLLTDQTELDTLPALTQNKQAAAHALETLIQARVQQLRLPADANPHTRMEQLAAGNDALRHAWQALLDLGRQAHGLNARNAALVEVHLRHTQQALQALRTSAGMTEIYTARGQARHLHNRTAIAAG